MPAEDPTVLLREWFEYWRSHDEMPSKMPESLHVRTVTYLTIKEYEEFQHTGRTEAFDKLRAAHHIPYQDEHHQGGNCADVFMNMALELHALDKKVRTLLHSVIDQSESPDVLASRAKNILGRLQDAND